MSDGAHSPAAPVGSPGDAGRDGVNGRRNWRRPARSRWRYCALLLALLALPVATGVSWPAALAGGGEVVGPLPARPTGPTGQGGAVAGATVAGEGAEGQPPAASAPARYLVYAGDTLVLEVVDQPGALVSTSAPPPRPGQAPATHPFLSASFFTPETEGELGALLRQSSSLADYLDRLRQAGYTVVEAPPPTQP